MKDILQSEHPVLRETAKSVPVDEIGSPKLNSLIADMKDALDAQKDGVGIAAPQVGAAVRMFIVSGSMLKQTDRRYRGDGSDLVFINPEIVKTSKEKQEVEEGCLSVRWLYGKVRRAARVTIRAYNEKGEKVERGASGLLAQIFQHEIDHLNGILFIDKAQNIWEMSAEEIRELQRK